MDINTFKQKKIEKSLREKEYLLSEAQRIAHVGSWELDLIHNQLTWSDEVYRIFGLDPQVFEATYEAFLEAVHPEDRTAVDEAYTRSLQEGKEGYEIEHRVIQKHTRKVRFVKEKCYHIRDESGVPIRSVGMIHDISDMKEAEHLRDDIERMTRHDLRTPLNGILGAVQLLKGDETVSSEAREYLDLIEKSGRHMLSMIDGSLSLYKMEQGSYKLDPENLRLEALFHDIQKEFEAELAARRTKLLITYEQTENVSDMAYFVRGEYSLCYSLFSNLIQNAIDACERGESIIVTVRRERPGWVTVSIWNKKPIPKTVQKRFGEKYSTSGKARGTGLGVYSAILMIKTQGGRFRWSSSENSGTAISVELPGAEKK